MPNLEIVKPVIIVGAPRSGTSLLLTILSSSKDLWSQYRETIDIWERFYKFSDKEFNDDLLTENDLDERSKLFLINEFHKFTFNNYFISSTIRKYLLENKTALEYIGNQNLIFKSLYLNKYRIVEKSPKTCFRIPLMNKLFPDCKFIFLKRDGRTNINSLIEGWKGPNIYSRKEFKDINLDIKNSPDKNWKFILPPGWKNYKNSSIEEISAFQWATSNKSAMNELKRIDDKRKIFIKYEDLIDSPYESIKTLSDFIEIPFSKELENISRNLPEVNYVSKPDKEKWKKNIDLIEKTYPVIEPVMKELGYSLS